MSYKNGEIVRGVVSGIQSYGAFIKIDEETTGLVHISEISNGYVKNIEDFIQLDKEYSFYILEYDEASKHCKLSFKKINDADKAKRKTSIHKQHYKRLEEYSLYFNDTFSLVGKCEEGLNTDDVEVKSSEEIDFDFDASKLNEFPNTILEKDVLKIQQLSYDDRVSLDYLIVLSNNDFDLMNSALTQFYNGLPCDRILFIKEKTPSSAIHSLLDKISNKTFKLIMVCEEDSLNFLAFYRIFKQKFIDDHPDLDYKNYFYFFLGNNVDDTKNLVNKEGYSFFEEPYGFNLDKILSFALLYILGFGGYDIFSFMNGYRKALIDVSNDNTIIKKLLSLKGQTYEKTCHFDFYLEHLGLSNIRVECNSPRLIIPHFKDNIKMIKQYEGKNLSDVINCSNNPKIVLNSTDSYSVGYLVYILTYTSLVKKTRS